MGCEYCDIIDRKSPSQVLFEDEEVLIAIKDKVATPGQITVFSRDHRPIMEMIPDETLAKCSIIANKVSVAAFESLGAKGTNIIIRNGTGAGQNVPHFGIDIIPRQENDGLDMLWQPKQIAEDEMERIFTQLSDGLKTLKQIPTEVDSTSEGVEIVEEEGEKPENYLLKSLRRIP